MKAPKNTPEKVGDRFRMRGKPDQGVITEIVNPDRNWVRVAWDHKDGQTICHRYELERL